MSEQTNASNTATETASAKRNVTGIGWPVSPGMSIRNAAPRIVMNNQAMSSATGMRWGVVVVRRRAR